MSNINQIYTIGKIKKLIDLNGDATNFRATFNIQSAEKQPFEAVILDQTTLDKQENPEFKQVPGILSGEIVADKNTYQNYYIALRSSTPLEVSIQTELEVLPDFIPSQEKEPPTQEDISQPKKVSSRMKYIILVLVLLVSVYLYMNSKNTSSNGQGSLLDKLRKVSIS